ncbi:MAG: deoxyribodipyrimidine photo-lyase, partial [Pseudorhodoplanes sp.]|nr:deoxyribodipyrimidine photo-lyase [Pseudorhodoplanes sp.]
MDSPVIVWFRDDLRLADHPALAAAARAGRPLICLYVLDEVSAGLRPLGGAARWWLAGSLRALDAELRALGQRLVLRRGKAAEIVPSVAQAAGAQTVYWNRRYDRSGMAAEEAVVAALKARGIGGGTFPGSLLVEPQKLAPNGPMRVFTPFYKRILALGALRAPQPRPGSLPPPTDIRGDTLTDWRLEPTKPDWAGGLRETWQPGEGVARKKLGDFLDAVGGYAEGRDRPDKPSTSRLSPHLRFGEISPLDIWHAARFAADQGRAPARDIDKFLSELGWREFSWHLLHHHPDLATVNLQRRFDDFPWRDDPAGLLAWQRGQTGYPIVDAGMRELWHTGWMHNRVRMVAASFLIKHLLIDWRAGEQWFWDTLVDADPASNPASWQWVAGSGADAAPYFRIF